MGHEQVIEQDSSFSLSFPFLCVSSKQDDSFDQWTNMLGRDNELLIYFIIPTRPRKLLDLIL
eukprot:scaffold479_cov97-Cylindrotheca_fusiformis.AAC.6